MFKTLKFIIGISRVITSKFVIKYLLNKYKNIIMDIGGSSSRIKFGMVNNSVPHPFWRNNPIISVNLNFRLCPVIVDNAVFLSKIPSDTVEGIYSSHMIEHISPDLSITMFNNWYRILKYNGRIEIRCPDLETSFSDCLQGLIPSSVFSEIILGLSIGKFQSHKNIYWFDKLKNELESVGFKNIRIINYNFQTPGLDYWNYDGPLVNFHGNKIKDLLIEAYKC